MADYILALDIGASKIIAAVFDHRGELIDVERARTPRSNVEKAIDHVIGKLLGRTGISYIAKAGIAAPGPINYREGVLEKPPNIHQDRVHVTDVVKRYTRHVIIANDGVAGIWAEKALVKQDLKNAVLVTIGTGIGGGVIVDGRLLIGSNGNAHEIGHIVVDVDSGLECGCGGVGHWEALAGGRWIPRTAKTLALSTSFDTELYHKARIGDITTGEIYEYAKKGDAFALHVVDYLNKIHAAGIVSIASTYDPEVVYLSGGLFARHKEVILDGIQRYLDKFAGRHLRFKVIESSFLEQQSLYGAYAIAYSPPIELVKLNQE